MAHRYTGVSIAHRRRLMKYNQLKLKPYYRVPIDGDMQDLEDLVKQYWIQDLTKKAISDKTGLKYNKVLSIIKKFEAG